MQKEKCAIIRCGRVGRALATVLNKAGYHISLLMDQNEKVLKELRESFPDSRLTQNYKNWPDFQCRKSNSLS